MEAKEDNPVVNEVKTYPTEAECEKICPRKIYGDKLKYPYINYTKYVVPSKEYNAFWAVQRGGRDFFMGKAWKKLDFRGNFEPVNVGSLIDKKNCKIRDIFIEDKFGLNNNFVHCAEVIYKTSSINNGVIIFLHGGAYCCLSHRPFIPVAEMLSKVTGCAVLMVNYKLAPDFPLPAAVNDVVTVYHYVLKQLCVPPKSVGLYGNSAGSGLVLLTLQSIKSGLNKDKKLPQPACAWVNSPWCNLNNDFKSHELCKDLDVSIHKTQLDICADWCAGNLDGNLNIIGSNSKKSPKFSACFGKWKDLCPIHFVVGVGEILLDDTLYAAEKAFKAGNKCSVDIYPTFGHCFIDFWNYYPEGEALFKDTVTKFFSKHIQLPKYELAYFSIRGRAYAIRIALRLSGINWNEKICGFGSDEFTNLRKNNKLIWGGYPELTIKRGNNKVTIGQSNAILRYVGKLNGLYPTNDIDAGIVDAIMDACEDMAGLFFGTENKLELLKPENEQNSIIYWLQRLELRIDENEKRGNKGFFVGNSITIAELKVFALYGIIADGFLGKHITIDSIFKPYKKLNALMNILLNDEVIAKFTAELLQNHAIWNKDKTKNEFKY